MVSTSASRADNGSEGSSTRPGTTATTAATLGDVMRAPSTRTPDVVVLDSVDCEGDVGEALDPREDLWLSSVDGRYNSPIIPLRVGTAPDCQTFYVHKSVLLKAEFFRKALCGGFRESDAQAIDLPEEDPAIFHFIVAFLYENKYVPIRAAATVLRPDDEQENARWAASGISAAAEDDQQQQQFGGGSDSESSASLPSDSSTARSQRRRDRRRRRETRHWERLRRKHPGMHRLGCACRQCLTRGGPPCWNCAAPRIPPQPPGLTSVHHMQLGGGVVVVNATPRPRPRRHRTQQQPPHNRHRQTSMPALERVDNESNDEGGAGAGGGGGGAGAEGGGARERIQSAQDLRTWLLAYELNLDVYICANKFLLDDFKRAVARACIDMLEAAGADAAEVEVLRLCRKLYQGLPEADALLRMVFARVGFLSPRLWRRAPDATAAFFHAHPEVSALMFRETLARREEDYHGIAAAGPPAAFAPGAAPGVGLAPGAPPAFAPADMLPAMERSVLPPHSAPIPPPGFHYNDLRPAHPLRRHQWRRADF
ncbi:hypothetical protein GGS23DRAFT_597796 [Durotheca rogersii]|uniref:uncharacterized protein n=1 Tax=Durotheca rogersii TaxID=419775 RepID=UPI00221EE005|nr:uncharacterized protein GGS23DRAFT_597796 [Durotheca rogersii]KAI5862178.1 hypothetical protein GGS23DRAFT_597796 [Durotheca rogersii]